MLYFIEKNTDIPYLKKLRYFAHLINKKLEKQIKAKEVSLNILATLYAPHITKTNDGINKIISSLEEYYKLMGLKKKEPNEDIDDEEIVNFLKGK